MASWKLGEPLEMKGETRLITLKVIIGSVFGMQAESMSMVESTIVELMDVNYWPTRLRMLLLGHGDERPANKLGRMVDLLDRQVYAEIAMRRQERDTERRSDVMSMLLSARDEDGAPLTIPRCVTSSSHCCWPDETTATTVAWAIELLVRHPDRLAALRCRDRCAGRGREG